MASNQTFAKMAGSLDSNRKIQRGGRNAREVYLWVLRQIALRSSDGDIPLEDVSDADYVARQLMCSEAEAREGFERCVTVALLAVDGDRCIVVGWDENWGRRAMTGAERVAKWRESNGKAKKNGANPVTKRNAVTNDVTCNAGEESREEESRGDRVTQANAADPPTAGVFHLDDSPPPRKPGRPRQVKHAIPDAWAPNLELQAEARSLGVDPLAQADRMRSWAIAEGARKCSWDETYRNWIRRSAEQAPTVRHHHRMPEV